MREKMSEHSNDTLTITKIDIREDIEKPNFFNVKYNNDDTTPFEFVIATLIQFFNLNKTLATDLAVAVHEQGSAVIEKEYTFEIAEHLVNTTVSTARQNNYPLSVEVIPAN
jgi:ATP-dependent Clp protease adaptor protein ClpS